MRSDKPINLRSARFLRDWQSPNKLPRDKLAATCWVCIVLFLVLAVIISQCATEPVVPQQVAHGAHYMAYGDDKVVKITDTTVEIGDYWEF